ncbi:hypothetical protein H6P81_018061 [Aristolochia fimbriata]|uniref:Uncharacterized protein n=1 Tax=Aristolochia fimbriata TaxID=158543 RepID=A0AAV7E0B8_ARIFI|nr:hypothetical protein H6P81_018061 [Aristolochia fimbriata]
MQENDKQLCEACERFKELLRRCPNRGIPRWMQMEIFYNGITNSTRSLIDAAAGGTMNKKTPNEVYELIEEMASNMYQYPVERSARGRVAGIHNVDHVLALQAQVESLAKQLSKLHTPSLVAQICDMCGGGHPNHECQAEALMQMPQHAKFLKEVLSGKRKVEEQGTVMLTEKCSAILKNQLPTKLKDPGSFTIPCEFGNFKFNKVLCDLGASINLMPLSICKKLNLGELKETNIMLQFADISTKKPNGLIEDVLVRVGKFIYPCDFVVLDMEVDWELPLILGRPFLATTTALIDVKQGKLTLRLNDEEIVFDIKQAIKSSSNLCDDACYFIDVIDECAKHVQQEVMMKDSLESCLAQSCTKEDDDPLMLQEVAQLEAEGNRE